MTVRFLSFPSSAPTSKHPISPSTHPPLHSKRKRKRIARVPKPQNPSSPEHPRCEITPNSTKSPNSERPYISRWEDHRVEIEDLYFVPGGEEKELEVAATCIFCRVYFSSFLDAEKGDGLLCARPRAQEPTNGVWQEVAADSVSVHT